MIENELAYSGVREPQAGIPSVSVSFGVRHLVLRRDDYRKNQVPDKHRGKMLHHIHSKKPMIIFGLGLAPHK